jgi:hypothetical protein
MEIIGDGLGLHSEDLYKRLKMISDIGEIIVENEKAGEGVVERR